MTPPPACGQLPHTEMRIFQGAEMTDTFRRTIAAASLLASLLYVNSTQAETRKGDVGAPASTTASGADAPLLKQPPMPMRRTTQKQRQDAAAKHKALREEEARKRGQPVPAARKMPQPQRLPESRDSK